MQKSVARSGLQESPAVEKASRSPQESCILSSFASRQLENRMTDNQKLQTTVEARAKRLSDLGTLKWCTPRQNSNITEVR